MEVMQCTFLASKLIKLYGRAILDDLFKET